MAIAADTPQIKAPPRTVADITELLNQYQPDPKKAEELRAILDSQPPQTEDKTDLANFYRKRADAAGELGALQRQAEYLYKVVDLVGVRVVTGEVGALIATEFRIGNMQSALNITQRTIDATPPHWFGNLFRYATKSAIFAHLGDFDAAQEALKKTETTYTAQRFSSSWAMWGHLFTAAVEFNRASVWAAQGKFAAAEVAARKAIQEALEDEPINKLRLLQKIGTNPQSLAEYRADDYRTLLAKILADQGKLTEAEQVAREAFQRSAMRTGAGSVEAARVLTTLAYVLAQQGRTVDAAQIVNASLRSLERAGVVNDSVAVIDLSRILSSILVAEGRYAEALREYQKVQAALVAYPNVQEKFAAGDVAWSLALLKTDKPDEALAMLNRLIPKSQQWLGEKHIDTAELVGVKGMALAAKGDKAAALDAFRDALPVLLNAAITQSDERSPLRSLRLKLILEAAMSLLVEIRGTPLESAAQIDAANEAFRLADALRNQSTQSAVASSATRAAANDPGIGNDIRKEQDLSQELTALHRILRDLMNAHTDKQLPKVIADMQKRIEAIKEERIILQADIEKRFPAYANLTRPQPPSLAEARAVLRPDEALINLYTSDTATYLWAFKKDGPVAFASAKLNRDELARRVQTLRKSLDPGEVDITTRIPEFDLNTAYRLYAELLAPVASGWQGATQLLVAANGALSQLPLAVLTTAKVTVKPDAKLPYEHFKEVPWLIRQAAFTYLPSVNALVALRKMPVASAQRSPFVGFGDPQFATTPVQVASTRSLRNLAVARPSQRDIEQAKPADWMDYSKIPPLPDTRDEILALAKALKADPDKDVFLGSQASKTNLMKLDLSKRRVVAFATHGLLPGDFPGVSEPSLALANPGNGQHGLLTLEDILSLKLDADWVVLSACNTAAGDGQGADALSGLGRAFFYAGSRALLVTQWPVESASARLLVTGIFERQAADAKLSRAEALRQSMLALMQQKSDSGRAFSYAHPLFWAPYVLVGEGGI